MVKLEKSVLKLWKTETTVKFIELVDGKFTAEELAIWFSENQKDGEAVCGKRYYLKIKPKKSFSEIRYIYHGQFAKH
ncbi:hypothetical protein [Algibacter lectus]|uniref:hypothetical protein n=1 Tax=Algibacter lectus TaxID=221126 RepID=UPI0010633E75|nr:hypothetical protein [Algibacter lectus]MWW25606.1 hypothetical protein [Algibacter lectus]